MTKNEMAAALAEKTGLTQSKSIHAIDYVMEIMSETLAASCEISIRGFGTFKIIRRKARKARNITKGTIMVIPEKNVIKFIPSKILKERITK